MNSAFLGFIEEIPLSDKNSIHASGSAYFRSRLIYASAVGGIVLMGLGVRYPGLGLPWPLAKYGGSILWGMMIYFIASFAAPQTSLFRRVGAASVIAVLVELVRLYHVPWLDDFRMMTAGALLLGRVFFSVECSGLLVRHLLRIDRG